VHILSDKELKSLQAVLLDMLLEVDRLCKKHGIEYGIDGGTLLGAVRHGGFIPWDDDLDVVMTRRNYERFREAAALDLDSGKYFFQDHTTDANYNWGYARIRRKNSVFIRAGHEKLQMRTGIFLDIFPRDMLPDNVVIRAAHCFYVFILRKALYSEVGKTLSDNIAKRAAYRLLNKIPSKSVFARLEASASFWNARSARYSKCYTFPIPRKYCLGYDHRWFTELGEIEFCGHMFPCAKDYAGYLTCDYGDYTQLPPPEKRRQHPCSEFRLPEDG
jgi:lipopolysaccharide cholinephosphotransferase